MRTEVDADTERLDFGRGLEHPDTLCSASFMHRQRQGQPGDAAADNDDVHENLLLTVRARMLAYSSAAQNPRTRGSGVAWPPVASVASTTMGQERFDGSLVRLSIVSRSGDVCRIAGERTELPQPRHHHCGAVRARRADRRS